MSSTRIIDPAFNETAIERIRVTFDQVANECSNSLTPIDLPEGTRGLKGKEGDFFYGINEEGVEGVAIIHSLGMAMIFRDGTVIYPEGMEELPLEGLDKYDQFYALLDEFMRVIDMPDKIEDPLEDEIDVEAGFGDDEEDGNSDDE